MHVAQNWLHLEKHPPFLQFSWKLFDFFWWKIWQIVFFFLWSSCSFWEDTFFARMRHLKMNGLFKRQFFDNNWEVSAIVGFSWSSKALTRSILLNASGRIHCANGKIHELVFTLVLHWVVQLSYITYLLTWKFVKR